MSLDSTIWSRIAESNQEAYTSIYRYMFRRFYNYGKKFISDENLIEDAAHEALMLVWEKRSSLKEIKYPETYFYTVFRNFLLTAIKHNKVSELPEQSPEEPGFNADQMIFLKEFNSEVKIKLSQAIHKLTPRQQEAIFLRFYEGLPFDEVAAILSITTKATYKIVARALSVIKENMHYPTLIFMASIFEFTNF